MWAFRLLTAVVFCFAAFHAAAVAIVNLPNSSARAELVPFIAWYQGPQLDQGWALFAPDPPHVNVHVLVRGAIRDGTITPWYDATTFFHDVRRGAPLSAVNVIGVGLAHSADGVWNDPGKRFHRANLARYAAFVLAKYNRKPLVKEEIELDARPIASPGAEPRRQVEVLSLGWIAP